MNFQLFPFTEFLILTLLGLAALVFALPLSMKLLRWLIAIGLTIMMIWLGMILAMSDGLKLSAFSSRVNQLPEIQSPFMGVIWGVILGIAVGGILLLMLLLLSRKVMPRLLARFEEEVKLPLWKRLVIAAYSGILEELIFRLFLLSLLAWLIGRFWHAEQSLPSLGALWVSNLLAAIAFSLVHLPRWSASGRLSPALIMLLIGMNGTGGLVFGYLFFTYGIESAMIAHFLGDSVLHVIGPVILAR